MFKRLDLIWFISDADRGPVGLRFTDKNSRKSIFDCYETENIRGYLKRLEYYFNSKNFSSSYRQTCK